MPEQARKVFWTRRRRVVLAVVLMALLFAYVGSYWVLSRRGYAQSKPLNVGGFYYFPPVDSDSWRTWNYGLVIFYGPINAVDCAIGSGEKPAGEPMFHLGKYKP